MAIAVPIYRWLKPHMHSWFGLVMAYRHSWPVWLAVNCAGVAIGVFFALI
jgi:hypothetical protein